MMRQLCARAIITGVGWVSPFGIGDQTLVTDVLAANTTAIGPLTGFATDDLRCHLGAEIAPAMLPLTEEGRRWSRLSSMTVMACRQAVTAAGLQEGESLAPLGLIVGTEFGDLRSTEAFALGFLRKGPLGLSPLLFPNTVMNAMAGTTSIALGIKGPMLTVNHPGVAGEVAVVRALTMIAAGRAPAMLVCGVDEIFPTLYATCARLGILSPRHGGEEACCPFDQRHNGPVIGEGAAALLIESLPHARQRGAPILAELYGSVWGSLHAHRHHYPRAKEISNRLLERLFTESRVTPDAVAVAYLSASGDPQHDAAELACMRAAFAPPGPLLTSVTHLTGDYGGLGTLRVAAAAVTVTTGHLPRLDYLQQPICPVSRFVTRRLTLPPRLAMVHGLARGGLQVALLIGPPSVAGWGE